MSFLYKDAPWGSPVVPSIPLPPFADNAEHNRYVRMLQLHLALLDDGAPAPATIALSLALEPPRFAIRTEDQSWLTSLELSVSLTSWFPAPWTPASLARTLSRVHHSPPELGGEKWYWTGDPNFTAEPQRDGGWVITRDERGSRRTEYLTDDRDLVVLWISQFRDKFAFPLAHGGYESDIAALAPASLAVSRADAIDAANPYRKSWRAEREAALLVAGTELHTAADANASDPPHTLVARPATPRGSAQPE